MAHTLVVANWKMNPADAASAAQIAQGIVRRAKGRARIVICPPFIYMSVVAKAIGRSKHVFLGAQDAFAGKGAAHTGEVDVGMVKHAGAKYVIVGHSERRAAGETDETVREKLFAVLKAGVTAILCIGEKERDLHGGYFSDIKRELEHAVRGLPKKFLPKLVVAYEPVWAIGASSAMQSADVHETAIFIRRVANDIFGKTAAEKIRILYGGSVTKQNARDIVEQGNVDGLLVGRESLKANEFAELVNELGK
ncbi:MAG: triose-phosphate isomerase [Patescibacteria group bacterium]|nr:triose-phosphate isomerase [Patescibacteria group bacterium]MDE1945703.1 triose-phosphate isomerase [Patescibacteria group bacterium]